MATEPEGIKDLLQDLDYNYDEDCKEVAEGRGQIVVVAQPHELYLDIDNDEDYAIFKRRFHELYAIVDKVVIWKVKEYQSKTGGSHRHIYIGAYTSGWRDGTFDTVPFNMDTWMRIALQFSLGSDPVRETLNTMRELAKVNNPIRLFESPDFIDPFFEEPFEEKNPYDNPDIDLFLHEAE